jgi:hypothetical protein
LVFFTAIVFCGTPMADLSETTILQTNAALNLGTGAIAGSGADFRWEGRAIAPQCSAKLRKIGLPGLTNFTGLPQSYFAPQAAAATSAPIPAAKLEPGDAFVVVHEQWSHGEGSDPGEQHGTGGAALQNSVRYTLAASGIDIGGSLADIYYSVRSTTQ